MTHALVSLEVRLGRVNAPSLESTHSVNIITVDDDSLAHPDVLVDFLEWDYESVLVDMRL